MKYEEVTDALLKAFPKFAYDDDNEGLHYLIAEDFARYILKAHKNNNIFILSRAGAFIENLYSYKDEQLDNLATVGYLEGIINVWASDEINPDEILEYLGEDSKKGWLYLNRAWYECDTCTEWFSKP